MIIIVLVLLTSFVCANVNFIQGEVKLDVDYGKFNNEDQTQITETTEEFTLENTGTEEVTVTITATGLPPDYETISKSVTISAGGTAATSLSIKVPHAQDSGKNSIGLISVKDASNNILDSTILIQNTKSMLVMEELEVEFVDQEGNSEKNSFDENDETCTLDEEVKLNTELQLDFSIMNLFDIDYDEDESVMENIKIAIEADDNDLFPDDFKEKYELEDLEADDENGFTISFQINEDADEGDYTLEITLAGEDGKGVEYEINKEVELELKRTEDDLRIVKAELKSAEIETCEDHFSLDIGLRNYGSDDQREAALSIFNAELGIVENLKNLNIEEYGDDDSWNKIFIFSLNNPKARTYWIEVIAYIDKDEEASRETVRLDLLKCTEEIEDVEEVEEKEEEITVETTEEAEETIEKTIGSEDKITSSIVFKTIEEPYTSDDYLLAAMFIAVVLLLTLIVIFSLVLARE